MAFIVALESFSSKEENISILAGLSLYEIENCSPYSSFAGKTIGCMAFNIWNESFVPTIGIEVLNMG